MKRLAPLALLLANGCAAQLPQAPRLPDQITLELQCGSVTDCPSYRISITPAGLLRWEGLGGIASRQVVESAVSPQKWDDAEAVLTRANWSALPDTSGSAANPACTGGQTASITRRAGSTTKTVVHHYPCGDPAIARLVHDLDFALAGPQPRYPPS